MNCRILLNSNNRLTFRLLACYLAGESTSLHCLILWDLHLSLDIGSNNCGYYDLQAVLTHQGRSSSSGHYVSWVKRKQDEWIKFDDDKVSIVTPEDILRLSGGGDWHIAYVLLYGPRRVEIMEEESEQ